MIREKTKITGVKDLFHATEHAITHGIFLRTVLIQNYKLKYKISMKF